MPNKQQIREARINAGLSQQQAANLVYAKVDTWRKWEYGTNPMNPAIWELFNHKLTTHYPSGRCRAHGDVCCKWCEVRQ